MNNIGYAIDLGTANTIIAAVEYTKNGFQYRIIPIKQDISDVCTEDTDILPSVVFISETTKHPYVGLCAIEKGKKEPGRLFKNTKRFLAREDFKEINGIRYGSTKTSEIILLRCKEAIERDLEQRRGSMKDPVDIRNIDIIITVPISYGNDQIALTKLAAVNAGFGKEHISTVKEPYAAVLDFVSNQSEDILELKKLNTKKNLLVYDVGGGTCDVCCISVNDHAGISMLNMLGSVDMGSEGFGGMDFDKKVAAYLMTSFYKQQDIDRRTLSKNNLDIIEEVFLNEAEKAKKYITDSTSVYVNNTPVPYGNTIISHQIKLSYEEYKAIVADMLTMEGEESMLQPINYMIEKLRRSREFYRIDYILLMGGMSRSIFIKEMIRERFKETDSKIIEPKDAITSIARGAALRHFDLVNKVCFMQIDGIEGKSDRSILMDVGEGELIELIKEDDFLPYSQIHQKKFKMNNRTKISLDIVSCFNSQLNTMKRSSTYMSTLLQPILEDHTVQLKVEMNTEYELKLTAMITTASGLYLEEPLQQRNMKYY